MLPYCSRPCPQSKRNYRNSAKRVAEDIFRLRFPPGIFTNEARVYELFRVIGYKDLVAFELARLTTFLPDKNIRRNIQALYNEKIEITPAAPTSTGLVN